MPKTTLDLKPLEEVFTKSHGLVQFIGYLDDGLFCLISTWEFIQDKDGKKVNRKPVNLTIPTSELIPIEYEVV